MESLIKLTEYIKVLIKEHFYGKIIISFEDGKIVHLKEEKNLKL